MRRARFTARVAVLGALALATSAHVGSPDTIWEGNAGPWPVRVIIRDPGVIPGLAEIVVRTKSPGVEEVSVTATVWNAQGGAPPPEKAFRVAGDSTLWSSHLWFMAASSYGVLVHLEGSAGLGDVIIPFTARASRVTGLPATLGWPLGLLAALLVTGLVTIVFAAVRESALPPGQAVNPRSTRTAMIGAIVALVFAAWLLREGRAWWGEEANAYAQGVLENQPFAARATVNTSDDSAQLTLTITDPAWRGSVDRPQGVNRRSRWTPLIPDHGKLMHAFLVSDEGNGFAHLHPVSQDSASFVAPMPSLPAGRYHLFADVVHESGWSQTMTATVTVPGGVTSWRPLDSDDAMSTETPSNDTIVRLETGLIVRRADAMITAGRDVTLDFQVVDSLGRTVTVEPYLGMAGHLVIVQDTSVFIHLHPMGTASSAASATLIKALKVTPSTDAMVHGEVGYPGELHFPYLFPRQGSYRIWLQFRYQGVIRTAPFLIGVLSDGQRR